MFLFITYMKKKNLFGGNKLAPLLGAGREFEAEALLNNHTCRKPIRVIEPKPAPLYNTKKTNMGNANDYSTVAR